MIELVDIALVRGQQVLLWDVNAHIPNGSVTVITGRAGAGKSYLMRLLRREFPPTQGTILLDRVPVQSWVPEQLNRRFAALPQRSVLHFPFSVRDVVDLGRNPHRTQEEHLRVVTNAMEMFDVRHLASEPYASLPASDQKRVQLARVLAQVLDADGKSPIHWILDEPAAHLDLAGVDCLERVTRMLVQRGACVLMAIRDPRVVARFADQVLVMEGGTFVHGPTEESSSVTSFRPAVRRGQARGSA
jgi:iron complex transport system ATP-binding protein